MKVIAQSLELTALILTQSLECEHCLDGDVVRGERRVGDALLKETFRRCPQHADHIETVAGVPQVVEGAAHAVVGGHARHWFTALYNDGIKLLLAYTRTTQVVQLLQLTLQWPITAYSDITVTYNSLQ